MPDIRPRWMPGARAISYVANRSGTMELHRANADGTGGDTVLAHHADGIFEGALSPDGQWIVARIRGGLGAQQRDIVGFHRGDTTAVPLIASPFDEDAFRISPDGRWIAYESDETGRREVYIRPFPNTNGGKMQASTEGGYAPLWAPNGRELFFVDVQRRMTVVAFTAGAEPRLGERRVLFTFPESLYLWQNDYYTPFDISPDGQRFIMARQVQAAGVRQEPLVVVENWFTELHQRLKGR
jgi:serine/threonine-protein kinase